MKRIADYNPRMKIIMLVRDPVERAYSQWKMYTLMGMEYRPFADAIRKEGRHGYVGRGMYASQLRRAVSLFGRHNILVLENDTLRHDHAGALSQVTGFLGIAPFPRLPENTIRGPVKPRVPVPEMSPMSPEEIDCLVSTYTREMREFAALTGIVFPRFQAVSSRAVAVAG